jgi:hypothetical protein
MTEDFLNLFDRHSSIDRARRHRPSEFVRVYFFKTNRASQLAETDFDPADF